MVGNAGTGEEGGDEMVTRVSGSRTAGIGVEEEVRGT
jgi:hypothetical protein